MATATPLDDLLAIEKLRQEELQEARIIQSAMLPARPLHQFDIIVSHQFQPVVEVGGDYLDYFVLSDGTIGLYLGDVSGKGLPAALYGALAIGTLRGIHKTGQRPARVLSLLNQRLNLRGIPARHTSIQYALFYPATSEMIISGAGMPGPFLLRGSECKALDVAGIPPGLLPDTAYDELSVQLEPGDSVLFCTDGLTEARSLDEQEFGLEGIQQICQHHSGDAPLDLLGHVFDALESFTRGRRQWDDMTATVFHYCLH
ncbi:MAG TPA: PP2C family protein-serine/threonine phosphatase [Candidatus Eremiobacteraceae bacterium]|nr:PP2C family protein-serine/threonine phosphatase [Candidatus Eremiobacteraceae bacterium]